MTLSCVARCRHPRPALAVVADPRVVLCACFPQHVQSDVMDNLRSRGVLERTVFVYSSDHGVWDCRLGRFTWCFHGWAPLPTGYKLGSWRIGTSKQHPYETDIRVPLLVRGPGIKAGSLPSMMVGNVDITPTLLELAGAAQPTVSLIAV